VSVLLMGTAYTGLLLASAVVAASVQAVRLVNGQTVGGAVPSYLVTWLVLSAGLVAVPAQHRPWGLWVQGERHGMYQVVEFLAGQAADDDGADASGGTLVRRSEPRQPLTCTGEGLARLASGWCGFSSVHPRCR